MRKRNIGIDLIKVIGCLGVVALHVCSKAFITSSHLVVDNGYTLFNQVLYYLGVVSVPFFFMVNGYFLLNKKAITYKYVINKILIILGISVSWSFIFSLQSWIGSGNSVYTLLTNVFSVYIQAGEFPQFWFFGSMVLILLIVPLFNKLLRNYKTVYYTVTTVLIITCLIIDLINHLKGSPVSLNVIQTFRFWTWGAYYLIGGILGSKMTKKGIISFNKLLVLTIVVIIYEILNKAWIGTPNAEYNYDNILVMCWIVVLFIKIVNINFNAVSDRVKNLILSISFSSMGIYIVHLKVLFLTMHVLDVKNPIVNILDLVVVFLISYGIVFLLSKTRYTLKLVSL